jgi:hypothetical protein
MRVRPLPLLLLTVLALGCGDRNVGSVSGRVTLDAKPLANAHVRFQPVGGGTAHAGMGSYGTTDANGDYTLSFMDGKGSGAVVGKHRVRITVGSPGSDASRDDRPRKAVPNPVPDKYNTNSTLEVEVHAGANAGVNFDLTTR